MDTVLYYLGFNHVPGIGPARLDRLIAYFGDLATAWHAPAAELGAAGIDARSLDALIRARRTLDLESRYAQITGQGIRLIARDNSDYPHLLAQITNPPYLLYVRGTLTEVDRWAVAVVGTRRASTYGKEVTRKLVTGLVAAGVTVISRLVN